MLIALVLIRIINVMSYAVSPLAFLHRLYSGFNLVEKGVQHVNAEHMSSSKWFTENVVEMVLLLQVGSLQQ